MNYAIGEDLQTFGKDLNLEVSGDGKKVRDYPFPKDNTVSITVGENESPENIHRRFLLQATSEAGLDGTRQQTEFVEKYIKSSINFADAKDDPSKNDGTAVKKGEMQAGSNSYILDSGQVEHLKQLQQEYVADGGKLQRGQDYSLPNSVNNSVNSPNIYDNSGVTKINLRQLAEQAEVLNLTSYGIPTDPFELKPFFVNLSNTSNLSKEDNALLTLISQNFGSGNLSMPHFQEIMSLAKDAGVKVQNLKVTGNSARFDLSVQDILKLKIAAITVQGKANAIEKVYRDVMDNNHISSFIRGVAKGSFNAIAGTVGLVADLPGTMKALWQVVSNPVETFNALYNELNETWDEFKNAPSEKKAEMVGELVGSTITEVLLGKGIGKFAGVLAKTKTGTELLKKAKALKVATIAEFSDEAALASSKRAKQRLATQLYSGIPADVLLDMAVVAGNKIKNGVESFAEFQTQMLAEFGDKVRPELRRLFDKSVDAIYGKRRDINIHELLGGHTIEKHVGKTEKWLRKRLEKETDITYASSFHNENIANKAQIEAIKQFGEEFDYWAKNSLSSKPIKITIELDESAGIIVGREKFGTQISNKVEIYVAKNNTERGWYIVTTYPIP